MRPASPALAQKKYGPGASDTEIRIGNTVPYSGPASAYGILGKASAAYFKKVNDDGGINGRKIIFISYDDAYSPPKTVEQTRKLVESDEVMAIMGNVGTAANAAIQKYVNAKKTPQLFLATGATRWNDPKGFPWTMGWLPSYHAEAAAYLKDLTLDGLLPGVMVNTSATDFAPIDQFQMMRFQGERWQRFGEVITGAAK